MNLNINFKPSRLLPTNTVLVLKPTIPDEIRKIQKMKSGKAVIIDNFSGKYSKNMQLKSSLYQKSKIILPSVLALCTARTEKSQNHPYSQGEDPLK